MCWECCRESLGTITTIDYHWLLWVWLSILSFLLIITTWLSIPLMITTIDCHNHWWSLPLIINTIDYHYHWLSLPLIINTFLLSSLFQQDLQWFLCHTWSYGQAWVISALSCLACWNSCRGPCRCRSDTYTYNYKIL